MRHCMTLAALALLLGVGSGALATTSTFSPVMDTYVRSNAPNSSYGSSQHIEVGYLDTTYTYEWGYIKFDLSSIPANATVTSASLHLYCTFYYTASGNTWIDYVCPATSSWDDNTTWNTRPSHDDSLGAPIYGLLGYPKWYTNAHPVDDEIQATVQSWVSGARTNYGFALIRDSMSYDRYAQFASRENSDSALRPYLSVTWESAAPPAPRIVSVQSPDTIRYGEWASIDVCVTNDGGTAPYGGISVSIPSFTSPTDLLLVSDDGSDPGAPGFQRFEAGNWIYPKSGAQCQAQYMLAEWAKSDWVPGETHWLKMAVLPKSSGPFVVQVRSAMGQAGAYVGTPAAGPLDQQGWWVQQKTIDVSPVPDISISDVSVSSTSGIPMPGQLLSVSFRVNNTGDAPSAICSNEVYWSTDSTITTSDVHLANGNTSSIPAHSSRDVIVGIRVPDDAVTKDRYYIGVIGDTSGTSGETNTGNNTSPAIGLQIDAVTVRMTPSAQLGDFYHSDGFASRQEYALGNRVPLILLHGCGSDFQSLSQNYFYWWLEELNRSERYYNVFKVYRYVYDTSKGIDENGAALAAFVNGRTEFANRSVMVLAHSMGGLVCRYALNTNATFRGKVAKAITLGTPHLGSPFADPVWVRHAYPYGEVTGLDQFWSNMVNIGEMFVFKGTRGEFDLAWHETVDLPPPSLWESLMVELTPPNGPYNTQLVRASMVTPFLSCAEMTATAANSKILAYGGRNADGVGGPANGFPGTGVHHAALHLAYHALAGISKQSGQFFLDNDGFVPLESALFSGSLVQGVSAFDLSTVLGKHLDHTSWLDDQDVINHVGQKLLDLAGAIGILQVTPSNQSVDSAGGTISLAVSNTGGGTMDWSASVTDGDDWCHILSGSSGSDGGTITLQCDANATALQRTATITVIAAGANNSPAAVTVTQANLPPVLQVEPSSRAVGYPNGTSSFGVQNAGGGTINWTAQVTGGSTWLRIIAGAGGSNAGTISVEFDPNPNTTVREGTLTVTAMGVQGSPMTVSVSQAADPRPQMRVAPAYRDVGWSAGTTSFNVSNIRIGTLNWTAEVLTGESWLSIIPPTSGVDAGTVQVSYQANTGTSPRTGMIRFNAPGAIGSPTDVEVTQGGTNPTLSVTPTDQSVGSAAGTTSFSVSNTGTGSFVWNASVTSGGEWMRITSDPPSGTNSGTITVSYDANASSGQRVGTISIAAVGAQGSPRSITVTQAPGNNPPSISGAQVAGSLTAEQAGSVTASCAATDIDGTVVSVIANFSEIGGPASQPLMKEVGETWNWSGILTPATDGTRTVTFTATDDDGATRSSTASIVVSPSGNPLDGPAFAPGTGQVFPYVMFVNLSCATPGATIRYTVDGIEPTATTGSVFTPGTPIRLTESTTIKAIACKDGRLTSIVAQSTYTKGYYWIPGDTNADDGVDVVDLLYLVDAFGSAIGDPNYSPACDFNGDGSVDVIDLLTMVENWGKRLDREYHFEFGWGGAGNGNDQLYRPDGIAFDLLGNILVADMYNHRIQTFTATGGYLSTLNGTAGAGQFLWPRVAVDSSGAIYVVEEGNHRVQKFAPNGTFIRAWGQQGSGDGDLWYPTDIAVDQAGYVYVADRFNRRIQKFTSDGAYVTKWGTKGSGLDQFISPGRVAVTPSGHVIVADGHWEVQNDRIMVFTSDGTLITVWGGYGTGDGQFYGPTGVAVDSYGFVYVSDSSGNRIQKFTEDGILLAKWGTGGGDPGQLNAPTGLAVDASGDVYVADCVNDRIQVFAPGATEP